MSWFALIAAVLKLVAVFFSAWWERNKRIKEMKEGAIKELKDGIKERDPSKVTAAYARAKRIIR